MSYISINQISAYGDDISRNELKSIDRRLRSIVETMEGTLPGNRAFGIDPDIIDGFPKKIINMLSINLNEKLEKYIPEISIAKIDGEQEKSGRLNVKIYVERRG